MTITFDLTIAQSLFDSSEKFPVDLDDAWKWLGYSKKETVLKALMSEHFDRGIDWDNTSLEKEVLFDRAGQPSDKYFLTVDCFKNLAMLARTETGKQVRRYFLDCEKALKQLQAAPNPTPIALPPAAVQLHNMVSSLQAIGLDLCNPRFKQGLQDLAVNMLGIAQSSLPGTATVYLGVAEKAEELGYPTGLVTQFRSQLGKYVASIGLPSKKEKRLCNGTQRPLNVYLDSPELSEAVCEFMDAKTLATANGGSI